jgi:hypothetical protein
MNNRQRTIDRQYSAEQQMLPPRPLAPHKGRGAVSNLQGRYEVNGREGFDDGWAAADEGGDVPAFKTQVTDEFAKSILSRNASPDIPFKVSLNPYRGCEHVNVEPTMCD